MDVTAVGAATLSEAIHAREVLCREVMTAHLDRIDDRNPTLNRLSQIAGAGGVGGTPTRPHRCEWCGVFDDFERRGQGFVAAQPRTHPALQLNTRAQLWRWVVVNDSPTPKVGRFRLTLVAEAEACDEELAMPLRIGDREMDVYHR